MIRFLTALLFGLGGLCTDGDVIGNDVSVSKHQNVAKFFEELLSLREGYVAVREEYVAVREESMDIREKANNVREEAHFAMISSFNMKDFANELKSSLMEAVELLMEEIVDQDGPTEQYMQDIMSGMTSLIDRFEVKVDWFADKLSKIEETVSAAEENMENIEAKIDNVRAIIEAKIESIIEQVDEIKQEVGSICESKPCTPSLLNRQVIIDKGYANCDAGWYDVQNQGIANDYCRWVGNCGCRGECSWWSCALAGSNKQYTEKGIYQEPSHGLMCRQVITDKGYANCGAGWYDVQKLGVANDYCRWVGSCGCRGKCSWWSCALAGSNKQNSGKGIYQEPRGGSLSRQDITDKGYANCGAGWYDMQNQGVANDYCRWVGNCGCRGECSWWSCALAGSNKQYTEKGIYQESSSGSMCRQVITDKGYANCDEGWYDVQNQGVANDYCRWVGNCGCRGECSWWSCALAGSNKQYTEKGVYEAPHYVVV